MSRIWDEHEKQEIVFAAQACQNHGCQYLNLSQQLEAATRREADYQLMLDDLGELVTLFGLPLGDMMNQSPRNVLLDCIQAARDQSAKLADLQDAAQGMVDWCDRRDQWWDEAYILQRSLWQSDQQPEEPTIGGGSLGAIVDTLEDTH